MVGWSRVGDWWLGGEASHFLLYKNQLGGFEEVSQKTLYKIQSAATLEGRAGLAVKLGRLFRKHS